MRGLRAHELKGGYDQRECDDQRRHQRENPQPEKDRSHAPLRHMQRSHGTPYRLYQHREQAIEQQETIERNRDFKQGKH